jgi:hypothetical protein
VTTPTAQCITQNSYKNRPNSPAGFMSDGGSINPWLDAQMRKTDVNFREANSRSMNNASRLKISSLNFANNNTVMTPKLSATEAT